MLRPRGSASAGRSSSNLPVSSPASGNNNGLVSNNKSSFSSSPWKFVFMVTRTKRTPILMLISFLLGMLVQNYVYLFAMQNSNHNDTTNKISTTPISNSNNNNDNDNNNNNLETKISPEFFGMIHRALVQQRHCQSIDQQQQQQQPIIDWTKSNLNNHTAHLPQFGILEAVQNYNPQDVATTMKYPYTCTLPPENECSETQFTVIFMAYNPDRLQKMYNQVLKFVTDSDFSKLVAEVVIVWNGERIVEETKLGQALVDLTKKYPVRISYPLKAGFINDLMNRYHPRLQIKTKAIMYYDDDGPFYSYKATLGGFELWKRNANAQIGAMARKLDLGKRQLLEKRAILNGPGDRFFISHCPIKGDEIRYNYNEFANFGANMVLPSGSFLHSNYMCFLWHPIFEEIRNYVRKHPVNPDDGTVSAIVSQLGGRAPKVYPRRINESKEQEDNSNNNNNNNRRLLSQEEQEQQDEDEMIISFKGNVTLQGVSNRRRRINHRRLMDGIDWDRGGGHDKKNRWGQLRSDAANSLIRYFGSINSGSIGWCYGTPFQKGEYCEPDMAKVGQLPWLNPDHTARDTCP